MTRARHDLLGKKYVEGLERQPTEAVRAARRGFVEKLDDLEVPAPRLWLRVGAPALGLAAAALVAFVLWPDPPLEVVLRGHPELKAELVQTRGGELQALDFSDGSEVTVQPESTLRVQQVTEQGATVTLAQGSAKVSVVHRSPKTHWNFMAGPYRVNVVGTRFELKWNPNAGGLVVQMDEGVVEVDGPGLVKQRVTTQQKLEAFADPPRASLYLGPDTEARPEPEESATEPSAASSAVRARPSAPAVVVRPSAPRVNGASWRELANRGEARRALDAAEQAGFTKLVNSLPQGDVLVLGEVARDAKAPARAKEAWHAVRERFRGSEAAVQAAIRLGVLAFEVDRDQAAGRGYFRAAISEAPNAPTAPAALGRWLELLVATHSDEATVVAKEYVARYPNGAQVELARSVLH